MECTETKNRLSEYIDGLLDAETESRVRKHLSTCRACADELVSLRALIRELGDLPPVEAPEDFLNQLHRRMDQPSAFLKIIRALFVPFRMKIPLQFAGAAVVAVLVFMVLNIQQSKDDLSQQPVPRKQERIVRGIVPAEPAPSAIREVPGPLLSAENPEGEKASPTPAPIELALVLRKDLLQPQVSAPPPTLNALPAEKNRRKRVTVAKQAQPRVTRETPKTLDEERPAPATPPPPDGAALSYKGLGAGPSVIPDRYLSSVRELVVLHKGSVLTIDYEEDSGNPRAILVEIPSARFGSFLDSLKKLGDVKPSPQAPLPGFQETIRARIRLLSSK